MTSRSSRIQADNQSGSSTSGEPEFLVVGKLGKPHGVRGEIVMDVYTEFPERLAPGVTVFVGSHYQAVQISKTRPHSRGMLLGFEGYQSRDEVASLRNMLVHVRTADRPELPEGDYYHHQLLGLHVIDENGAEIGRITAIIDTGANDVYVIQNESGEEVLIPGIESVVKDIDLEKNRVTIHLLPGLMPGE